MSMKKIRSNIFYLYTVFFVTFMLIALIPSQIKTGTLFGVGLFTDGIKQHLVFMQDFVKNISNSFSNIPLRIYRFDIGLGADFLLNYGYYSLFDPLTIIAYIIPINYIEFSYYLLIVLRIYLSGIAIIFLAKKFNIRSVPALLGTAIFYCFNLTVLYSAFRHPMFINGPLLIPLIILGAEKVFRGESPFLLVVSSFLGLITQFYFYIYASFGFELFVLIRIFLQKKEKNTRALIKEFFHINLLYALGAFLGGFVLFPQLLATINGGRTNSKGFIVYKGFDYLSILSSFLIPVIGNRYSASVGNILILFVVFLFIFSKKRSWEKYFFLILSSLLFISLFGYAINVFSYVNNRWTYLIILPTALMLGQVLDKPETIKDSSFIPATRAILIIISLIVGFGVLTLVDLLDNTLLSIISTVIVIGLEYFALKFISKVQFGLKFKPLIQPKRLLRLTLITSFLILFGTAFAYNFFLTASEGLSAYADGEALSYFDNDDSFYRVEQTTYVLGSDFLGNDGLVYGYPSTHSYNTMFNGNIYNMIEYFNVVNHNNSVGYNGFNQRSILSAISHVKYHIIRDSDKVVVPFGYRLDQEVKLVKFTDKYNKVVETGYIEYDGKNPVYEDAGIYVNENFLNFGFVYQNYIRLSELENISKLGRERVLLDAVILDEDCNLPLYQANDLPAYSIADIKMNNLMLEGNIIKVSSGGGFLEFQIDNVHNSEVFIEITGLKKNNRYQNYQVVYEASDDFGNESWHNEKYYGYGRNFHISNPNHLVNLGYFNTNDLKVRISFEEGFYDYQNLSYYLNPQDELIEKIAKLNQETLEELEFKTNGFSGKIELEKDGFLCISLPYSQGFTAFVDGEETKIHQANIGYMGIFLSKGQHEIEFVYQTLGLKTGMFVSISSLGIFTLVCLYYVSKYSKKSTRKN